MIIGGKNKPAAYPGLKAKPRLDPKGVMEIKVVRQPEKDGAILGRMTVDGVWICYTLENPAHVIAPCRSEVVLFPSQHFGRLMPLLKDVPNRTDILIHWGDFPKDSLGCLLVGFTVVSSNDIGASRAAFSELFGQIEEAIKAGQKVWCTIG